MFRDSAKKPPILQLWPNRRKLCRWLKIQWKGNGVMFVASRWYAPWFPQGLPNKQETVGFVCRLSAPVVVGHPAPGHMCVPLICGWGVGATHHPEKGVCAHTHAWACAGKIRGEGTCADNVEHLVFVLASLGCSRSRSRSRCRGTCTRRRADGRFSMRAHVHTIWLRCFGDALKHSSSFQSVAWHCDEYWCWGNSES